jgi:mRNA interferase HigB
MRLFGIKPYRRRGRKWRKSKVNDYRLVVAINYRHQIVFIKWIGTHEDYDKIDVKTVKYGHQPH